MSFLYSDTVFMIFCKAPVPGQVKTRLMPVYSAQQAADIHIRLSRRILSLVSRTQLCPVQLWCSPSTDFPFFKQCRDTYNLSLHSQQGDDLGERMFLAFCSALSKYYKHAIIIGCDCPSLTENDLSEAIQALKQGNDVVLAPAEDGGYVLIGLNQPHAEIFNKISWGETTVLNATRNRITESNLTFHELRVQWDVDTADDLKRINRQ